MKTTALALILMLRSWRRCRPRPEVGVAVILAAEVALAVLNGFAARQVYSAVRTAHHIANFLVRFPGRSGALCQADQNPHHQANTQQEYQYAHAEHGS